ncbi:MAG: TIGR03905 family TSCPD domain-containing protein [Ruminococcaceae bacterium]|nr:TIGR03905 family TSCPD domain-containing protein [Oscillospiraceae bacterium]
MTSFTYQTRGVCSRAIELEIDGDIIASVRFIGGCAGNTQGVAALIQGMTVQAAIDRLKGIDCRGRGTSCPDQLARALSEYIEKKINGGSL